MGFSDAQVRKDLAYFGHFGHPGIGYRSAELISAIRRILGTDRDWPVVIVGTGNLGRALLGYRGFSHQGFRIVAAFDVDPAKVGTTIEGVSVLHINDLSDVVQQNQIKLGLIAVPAATAQSRFRPAGGRGGRGNRQLRAGHAGLAAGCQPGGRRPGD